MFGSDPTGPIMLGRKIELHASLYRPLALPL
jgi:hypothetical protein